MGAMVKQWLPWLSVTERWALVVTANSMNDLLFKAPHPITECENYVETFDPLKTRSSSSSSVIRDSRDSLAISDELTSLLQQPSPPAAVLMQKERQTMAKSSSASCCTLDNDNLLHPNSEVDTSLRHASSDPMLLEQEDTNQWNGVNRRHRSSSYDDIDDRFTRSEGAPMFYIDSCEPASSSLVDIQRKKNKKHSKSSSIFYDQLSPKSSPKTSPKHSPKNSPQMNKKRHNTSMGLPKSSKLISKSRAQANSPALSKRKPRSATMDALVSSSEHEKNKAPLARHFRPGVLMLKDLNPRMSIIQKKLKEREKDFCFTEQMK